MPLCGVQLPHMGWFHSYHSSGSPGVEGNSPHCLSFSLYLFNSPMYSPQCCLYPLSTDIITTSVPSNSQIGSLHPSGGLTIPTFHHKATLFLFSFQILDSIDFPIFFISLPFTGIVYLNMSFLLPMTSLLSKREWPSICHTIGTR